MDWAACYREGDTPWEKGESHPELPFLLDRYRQLVSQARHILVPGCGFGHDVALIESIATGRIEGLDIAEEAVSAARKRYSSARIDWSCGDLFEWSDGRVGKYDLVWEHTCFSGIPPARRVDFAAAMAELIPSGGCLLGIFFPNPDHPIGEGPPFHVPLEELHQLFGADFELEWSEEPSRTYESRRGEGREISMLWRRK